MGLAATVMALGRDYDAARATGFKTMVARMKGVGFVAFNYAENSVTVWFDSKETDLGELDDLVRWERNRVRPNARLQ
ncbi:MAG TPA: hypothetical protein VMS77_00450 [Conexivisphaerales archaeon]|nr:hypothetical protein [Conexivisphaerales archaeon]